MGSEGSTTRGGWIAGSWDDLDFSGSWTDCFEAEFADGHCNSELVFLGDWELMVFLGDWEVVIFLGEWELVFLGVSSR